MTTAKVPAAIVGPENIGTDLFAKLSNSSVIDVGYMVGVVESEGLTRSRARGIKASPDGVDWLLEQDPLPEIVLEAASAKAHATHAPRYEEADIQATDLTPAHLGPVVSPAVNGAEHIGSSNTTEPW